VIRTRAGEQVAAAILLGIGQNAEKGEPRAVKARRYIQKAISTIPLQTLKKLPALRRERRAQEQFARVVVGAESPEQYAAQAITLLPVVGIRGIVALANGPCLLKTGRARVIAQAFTTPIERHAFCVSRKHCGHVDSAQRANFHPSVQRAMTIGNAFGLAQKIQAVRLPDSRISDFDVAIGWELGE